MRDPGFEFEKPKYFRGNGRWSKVTRVHDEVGEPVKDIQLWQAKFLVAYGIEGSKQADAKPFDTFDERSDAETVAQHWIDYGTICLD